MPSTIVQEYISQGASGAALAAYRSTVNANDGVDLATRLTGVALEPTNRKQNVAVSCRFDNTVDSADITLCLYHPDAAGDPVPISAETILNVAPGVFRQGATAAYFSDTLVFDTHGCALWEVRVSGLSGGGCIGTMLAWTF